MANSCRRGNGLLRSDELDDFGAIAFAELSGDLKSQLGSDHAEAPARVSAKRDPNPKG